MGAHFAKHQGGLWAPFSYAPRAGPAGPLGRYRRMARGQGTPSGTRACTARGYSGASCCGRAYALRSHLSLQLGDAHDLITSGNHCMFCGASQPPTASGMM